MVSSLPSNDRPRSLFHSMAEFLAKPRRNRSLMAFFVGQIPLKQRAENNLHVLAGKT
jgi:hypothetical protein